MSHLFEIIHHNFNIIIGSQSKTDPTSFLLGVIYGGGLPPILIYVSDSLPFRYSTESRVVVGVPKLTYLGHC